LTAEKKANMACVEKSKLVNSLFLIVNFIIWILGVALMVIGVIDRIIAQYLIKDSEYVFNATNLLIAIGVIVTSLGLLGCFAAYMKVRYLLTVYGLLLLLIFVLEVLTGVYTYSKRDSVQHNVFQYIYNGTKTGYAGRDEKSMKLTHDIDWFQENLQCCGMHGPADWQNATWYANLEKPRNESVPLSCCKPPRKHGCNAHIEDHPEMVFEVGCSERGKEYFMRKVSIIGGLIVFSSVSGVAGAVLAFLLCMVFQKDVKAVDYAPINSR